MLSACEYQVLQTVSAWLDLHENEILFVEGAEDFDKASQTKAEAVQVKASPKPISLGQKEMQQALNNFWKLRNAAPGRSVRMRYLTCAPFTVERDSPFGSEVACLEIWQRTSMTDEETEQLSSYLKRQTHIQTDFRRWLERASLSQFRSELIECVVWQTNSGDAEFVERGIHNKLAAFSKRRGMMLASDVKNLAQRLVAEVWRVLRKPAARSLDLFRLLELWEETHCISVPRSALEARLSEGTAPRLALSGEPVKLIKTGTPPLPGGVAQRQKLVERYRLLLASNGFLNLHGSTRMGKTTLAKLIALPDIQGWKWWSAARLKLDDIQRALEMVVLEVARSPNAISVVLDDIDFSPTTAHVIEDHLGELLAMVRGRRGRVLITSQKPLPRRLQHLFGVGVDHVVAVPRMDKEEVGEFAEALGCPDDRRLGWAGIVWISTGGHPQLSAVRLWALREQGWPSLSADTFLNAGVDAIASEKSDARQLAEGLPIAQRELLNRLSVFPVVFRRDHAIAIGATSPSIQAPGNAFDPLVGPWLEPLHAGCYSLSPLLADSALHSLSPQDLKTLRTEAARILLRTKPCSTTEGANAFMLLWQTRNVGCLAQLAQSFIDLRANVLADLAEQLVWFTLVGLQRGDKLFPEAPPVGLLLRSLQFRIALLSAPERAAEIVDAWYCEVECADCPEPALHHMLLAGHVLPHPQVLLSARVVVKLLREVSKAATAHPELKLPQSLPRDSESHLEYIPKWKDPVSTFSFFCSARCMTIDYLDEFLTALETIDPELRDRILRGFIGGNIEAQMAVDRTWLTQSKQQSPNWKQCLSVFKRTYTLGQAWQCSALATAAMRGICVVLDEYLEDHQSAHENLDQMESEGGLALHMIHDRRACIFLSEGKHEAAEEQWRLALASWPRQLAPFDTGAAFAARNAGLCAARQARWEPAAAWFMEIVWRIPSSNEAAFIAGAYADAAYCLWKAGRMGDALLQLIEAWKVAEELPSGPENLRAFITRKRVGHVIAWLHGKTTYRGICNLAEPQAGFCTSPELAEKMRELPETESGNVWFFLMRLERELDAGNRAAELAKATLKEVARPATQAMLAMEAIAQNMVSGDVMNLPAKILALKRAVHTAAQFESLLPDNIGTQGSPEIFVKGDTLCGAPALLAGLIAAESKGYSWRELLAQWRESLSGGVDDTWIKWFDTTEQILGGSTAAAGALARNPGEDWTGSLLASWLLLVSDQSSADEIFLAHARWLGVVDISCWFRDVAVAFCQQIELAWIRACSRPALLLQPRLNVPLIKLACTEGKRGLAKAARILLAGAPAVTERLAPEMEAAFRKLAQTQ